MRTFVLSVSLLASAHWACSASATQSSGASASSGSSSADRPTATAAEAPPPAPVYSRYSPPLPLSVPMEEGVEQGAAPLALARHVKPLSQPVYITVTERALRIGRLADSADQQPMGAFPGTDVTLADLPAQVARHRDRKIAVGGQGPADETDESDGADGGDPDPDAPDPPPPPRRLTVKERLAGRDKRATGKSSTFKPIVGSAVSDLSMGKLSGLDDTSGYSDALTKEPDSKSFAGNKELLRVCHKADEPPLLSAPASVSAMRVWHVLATLCDTGVRLAVGGGGRTRAGQHLLRLSARLSQSDYDRSRSRRSDPPLVIGVVGDLYHHLRVPPEAHVAGFVSRGSDASAMARGLRAIAERSHTNLGQGTVRSDQMWLVIDQSARVGDIVKLLDAAADIGATDVTLMSYRDWGKYSEFAARVARHEQYTTGRGYDTGVRRRDASSRSQMRVVSSSVTAGLSQEVVDKYVQGRFWWLKSCYASGMDEDPALGSDVSLDFTIEPDGAVGNIQIGAPLPIVETCITEALGRQRFPIPDKAQQVRVRYDLFFRPSLSE